MIDHDEAWRDEAWERRLEWGLAENEGGTPASDVTARVMAAVEVEAGRSAARPPRRRLPVAALLIGVGVVAGVWLLSRSSRKPAPATIPGEEPYDEQPLEQEPRRQEPQWVVVRTPQEAETLPPDTRAVQVIDLGDAEVEVIARRCPQLESLHVSNMKTPQSSPTDRVFAIAATLTKLRELQLAKARRVTGAGLDQLARLPVLETLCFAFMDIPDDALVAVTTFPALRLLDLSYTKGFGSKAMAAIGRCLGLRQLGIPGCRQLTADAVLPIADLKNLEILEARQLECSLDDLRLDRLQKLRHVDLQRAILGKVFLDHLPPSITKLKLGSATIDDSGCKVLRERLPSLRSLSLNSTAVGDVGVAHLLALRYLHDLDLSDCRNVSATSIDILERASQLHRVVLGGHPWLTPTQMERLYANGIAVELAVMPGLVPDSDALAQLRQRYADAVRARAEGAAFTIVTSAAEVESLPADTLAVEGHDLDDAAVAALVHRLPQLQRLRLRSGEQKKTYNGSFAPQTNTGNRRDLTDAGITALAALPDLVELELAGTVAVGDQGIASLQKLPKLARLHLCCFDVSDAALATLPAMPALRALHIELSFGFGAAGLRAIAACRQLEELTLGGLPHLQGDDLAELGRLANLRRLTLANLSTTRNDNDRPLSAPEQASRTAALAAAGQPGTGVTDSVMAALGALTGLEELRLAWPRITSDGLAPIAGMRRLQTLSLIGCTWLRGGDLKILPRSIATLDLAGCELFDDSVAAGVAGMQLQSLNLAQCRALTDTGLARLVADHPLERFLGLYGCMGLTAVSADLLFATARIRELDVTSCAGWSKERAEQARADGRRVAYRIW
jgi:hypothetical protein